MGEENIIDRCLEKTLEMEANEVVPYTITDQVFKSNRLYPTYIKIHDKVNKNGDMLIMSIGDNIMEIKSNSGKPFKFKFTNNPEIFVSDLHGVFRFENGLPILPSLFMRILNVDNDTFNVKYEYYGDKYRKILATTKYEQIDEDPHSNYGVKVPINGNMYQIYGIGYNICHIGTYVKRD